ncbi:Clan CA, family C19, ubiquitin hydrolase-like cysteine peptidase [Histomonas meleagridis]|uniref:Clan CA, family C19, ubiquitin hydrolase-like cysteine peptidase n=1 Tax=Histomonas meleagridis TaxID=135588 RepID=UPI00355956A5|nr:Clan CA, family C19, ubiquitin hydrolase-like cysteine peptidase [Histomonas meleagridis]KAH0806237.1 Clan CA, family C19, ubiquitin hydrolase-like cysteine peptidase [Histomonas meleagridis]
MKSIYDQLIQTIETRKYTEKDTGYLISASFVKELESSSKDNIPILEINNKDLKNKSRLKPNLKPNIDYFVVPKEEWEDLLMEFGSGMEIKCNFDCLGNSKLYSIDILVNFQNTTKKLNLSKYSTFTQLTDYLRQLFSIPEENEIVLSLDKNKIEDTGYITPKLTNSSVITVTTQHKKPPPPPKQPSKPRSNPKKDKKFITKKSSPYPGLKNLGNTCYMNASLQCLISLPHFITSLSQFPNKFLITSFIQFYKSITQTDDSVFDPTQLRRSFITLVPFFGDKTQHDSHEFLSFFIDKLHEENSELINPLFYGESASKTTCSNCHHSTEINETFSSISLPIASSRRIIFSPWNLDEQMQRMNSIPPLPVILLGKTRNLETKLTTSFTYEFVEVLALEIPPHFDEEENLGLTILWLQSKDRKICEPLLVRVPLNTEQSTYDLEIIVWNRIEMLFEKEWRKKSIKSFKIVDPPKMFTLMNDGVNNKYMCNEHLVVSINEPYGDLKYGFKSIRKVAISNPISIEELIDSYFNEIQLDIDNKWKCEKCFNETCAIHKINLLKLPKNLILHFKRFSLGKTYERDNSKIVLDNEIDLSEFFLNKDGKRHKYELVGVINHTGSLNSGHYTAMAKRNGNWFAFNDAKVTKCDLTKESQAAYIAFFSEITE